MGPFRRQGSLLDGLLSGYPKSPVSPDGVQGDGGQSWPEPTVDVGDIGRQSLDLLDDDRGGDQRPAPIGHMTMDAQGKRGMGAMGWQDGPQTRRPDENWADQYYKRYGSLNELRTVHGGGGAGMFGRHPPEPGAMPSGKSAEDTKNLKRPRDVYVPGGGLRLQSFISGGQSLD